MKTFGITWVAVIATIAAVGYAQEPTIEISDGSKSLLDQTKDWKDITYANWWYNNEALKQTQQIMEKKRGMREEALQISNVLPWSDHISLLSDADGSSLDLEMKGSEDFQKVLRETRLSPSYVSLGGQIKVASLAMKQPVWQVTEESASSATFSTRTKNLLLKVAARARATPYQDTQVLENTIYGAAESLLPQKMLKNFEPRKTVSYVLNKAGITQVADGITTRRTVPQDAAFAEFANLGCDRGDATLFWADPMVTEGYDPVLGTALNGTALKGYRGVDMDTVVSQGYHQAINKWNLLKEEAKRVQNPFRGYAAKVMPGLMVMGEQGRLTPGEPPTQAQLTEARELTKKLTMLPSQYFKPKAQKASFRFGYPARMILTQAAADAGATTDVRLSKLDGKVFDNVMRINQKRMREIAKLKDDNLKGRQYVEKIIESYTQMDQAASGLADAMDPKKSIPQLTRIRKDILSSIEESRWRLSNLHFEYDKLLQKEWEVLENTLKTQDEHVRKLMDQASLRYRTRMMAQDAADSSSPQP